MKLHFNTKTIIHSLPPQTVLRHNELLITYISPHISIIDIASQKIIKKLKYENVQAIKRITIYYMSALVTYI